MRPFQIILFGVFAAFAVGGLLFFAAFRGFVGETDALTAGVEIWGTFNQTEFTEILENIVDTDDRWETVRYKEIDARTYESDLVNAIAENRGPSLIILPSDMLARLYPKLTPISYETFPVRDFRDTYVDGAEIFMLPDGTYALPFALDPLVMYWNRSMVAQGNLTNPPRTWEELVVTTVPALTRRTDSGDITESAIAFGEFTNIKNAKDILVLLMHQAGSDIVTLDTENGFSADLNASSRDTPTPPGVAAANFFTEFSNPAKSVYSWNRGLRNDRDEFLGERLALYFGFGTELNDILDGNPNLDMDLAEVPQSDNGQKRGHGIFYGFAIPKSAPNRAGAYEVATVLGRDVQATALLAAYGLAPAHRSVIAAGSGNPFTDVLYRAALIARGWLDPSPGESDTILSDMIDAISSGRVTTTDAVEDASVKLDHAF